jgi:hypothetical protein
VPRHGQEDPDVFPIRHLALRGQIEMFRYLNTVSGN